MDPHWIAYNNYRAQLDAWNAQFGDRYRYEWNIIQNDYVNHPNQQPVLLQYPDGQVMPSVADPTQGGFVPLTEYLNPLPPEVPMPPMPPQMMFGQQMGYAPPVYAPPPPQAVFAPPLPQPVFVAPPPPPPQPQQVYDEPQPEEEAAQVAAGGRAPGELPVPAVFPPVPIFDNIQVYVHDVQLNATLKYNNNRGTLIRLLNVTRLSVQVEGHDHPYTTQALLAICQTVGVPYVLQNCGGASILAIQAGEREELHWYAFAYDRLTTECVATSRPITDDSFLDSNVKKLPKVEGKDDHYLEERPNSLLLSHARNFTFLFDNALNQNPLNRRRVLQVVYGGWLAVFVPGTPEKPNLRCVILIENEYLIIEPPELRFLYRRVFNTRRTSCPELFLKMDLLHVPLDAANPVGAIEGMMIFRACCQPDTNGDGTYVISGENNAVVNLPYMQVLLTLSTNTQKRYFDRPPEGGQPPPPPDDEQRDDEDSDEEEGDDMEFGAGQPGEDEGDQDFRGGRGERGGQTPRSTYRGRGDRSRGGHWGDRQSGSGGPQFRDNRGRRGSDWSSGGGQRRDYRDHRGQSGGRGGHEGQSSGCGGYEGQSGGRGGYEGQSGGHGGDGGQDGQRDRRGGRVARRSWQGRRGGGGQR